MNLMTTEELANLTGFVRPSKQIEWLRAEGFTFRVGADGHPKVATEHCLKLLGAAESGRRKTEPNWSSLNGQAA